MEDLVCPTELDEPPGSKGSMINSEIVSNINPSDVDMHAINNRTNQFRRMFFPLITEQDWNNWRWQIQNSARTLADLERLIRLSDRERDAIKQHAGLMPIRVTPYYASLIDIENAEHAIRRMVIMTEDEFCTLPSEKDDPLNEDNCSPVPGLIHRYPDRVLFLVTKFCSVYCRYCTRSRLVGSTDNKITFDVRQWNAAIQYIEKTTTIRDVLLSGGDPLTLTNDQLEWLLSRLRQIPHVEIIRIGTKIPVVLPQRITLSLTNMLKKYHPLWMSIHFSHPDEITPEVAYACRLLAEAAIPLGSQTVLLKGINDNIEIMKRLYQGLLKILVKPYYLYQCDPVSGSSHFRTSIEKGLEIIEGLRGHTSGYAVPHYVIDAPGGGGKIPLIPNYVVKQDEQQWTLRNYKYKIFDYPNVMGHHR